VGIARAKFSVPEILGDPIETEQRMIRRTPPFLRIVTDPGHLLFSIKDKHGRIQIEDHLGRELGFCNHGEEKPVVEFP
jgi:hypothetical protein